MFSHDNKYKLRLCVAMLSGKCTNGEFCVDAHSAQDIPPGYKSTLCSYNVTGSCKKGQTCFFAHGEDELNEFAQQLSALSALAGGVPS